MADVIVGVCCGWLILAVIVGAWVWALCRIKARADRWEYRASPAEAGAHKEADDAE